MANVCAIPPAYAGSHRCKAVEECAAGVLRSLGEGGHASAGSAEDTKRTTAVRPWGSTATKTCDLGKDVPHPVTGLSPSS